MEQASLSQIRPSAQAAIGGVVAPGTDRDDPPVQATQLPGTGYGTDRLQSLQFAAIMMPQMAYIDTSRQIARGGSRSRTALESSTGLAQHQRVHDADESGFTVVHESGNRLTGYYDPNRSVVFQTSVRERAQDWRDEGHKKRSWARKRTKRANPDGVGLSDDALDTVVRVAQAAWTVAAHRAHVEQLAKHEAQDGALSPAVALAIRALVCETAAPGMRGKARQNSSRRGGRVLKTRVLRRDAGQSRT